MFKDKNLRSTAIGVFDHSCKSDTIILDSGFTSFAMFDNEKEFVIYDDYTYPLASPQVILEKLENNNFQVSTDSRKDVSGSIYFALKGDNFDGNKFVHEALKKGALGAVTDDPKMAGGNVYLVENVLETLQLLAKNYRRSFNIPIIALGGSNGKTTSKELISEVLKISHRVHASRENLNNHFGVPLSILSMNRDTEIGIFEVGANHPGEHTKLLEMISPTLVIVTNNGLDHLEGFGSPLGVRRANKEIYDWARKHKARAFVNKRNADLLYDSKSLERVLYPGEDLDTVEVSPLTFTHKGKRHVTQMAGDYNIENIQLALSVGKFFNLDTRKALNAICSWRPSSKRSQFIKAGNFRVIMDCYNANPSSMMLSLKSFMKVGDNSKGVVLGDMLELGSYSDKEHKKIVEYVSRQKLDRVIFIGENFKKALLKSNFDHQWFPNSSEAREWFQYQKCDGFIFLLKGSRGMEVEKVLNLSEQI